MRPDGDGSHNVQGLIPAGRRRIAENARGEVLDAAIIGLVQRIEHYEIAAYGCRE